MFHPHINKIKAAILVALAITVIGGLSMTKDSNPNKSLEKASVENNSKDLTSATYYEPSKIKFLDFEVENRIFDPYDDQEAQINFIVNQDTYITLEIFDEDDEVIATPVEKRLFGKGEYTVSWDGEDHFGEIVDEDEYEFKLRAETINQKKTEKGTFIVKKGYDQKPQTADPRLRRVFATKETFDPGLNEPNYIFFTTLAKADVKVIVYDKDDQKVETLLNQDDLDPGTYSVQWQGDEFVNKKGKYNFRVFAQNDEGTDTAEGKITLEEEDKENKKPNVYKDTTGQYAFNPGKEPLAITFKQELDSDVTIEIRDEKRVLATVINEENLIEGSHTIYWNGKDKNGDLVDDGIYQYKLIAANFKGKDVEYGNFQVENASKAKNPFGRCGGFEDVDKTHPYCDAIEYVKSQGIYGGYPDGTFKPNASINRAEALKVILLTFKIKTTGYSNYNLSFTDTNKYDWYAPFLRAALDLGIVNGYKDGTFRPGNLVNRAEGLVILLNTAKVKDGITVPTNYFAQPYFDVPSDENTRWYISYGWFAKVYKLTDNDAYFFPQNYLTRGELADMIYRYDKAEIQ